MCSHYSRYMPLTAITQALLAQRVTEYRQAEQALHTARTALIDAVFAAKQEGATTKQVMAITGWSRGHVKNIARFAPAPPASV